MASSCFCFIRKSIFPTTWKPLKHRLAAFLCFASSILSIILCITSLGLSFTLTGYPTHSSSTPGVWTSLIGAISCFYSCYLLYYPHLFKSPKSFCINLLFLSFIYITCLITATSAIFITPSCAWYAYGLIPWCIVGTGTVILVLLRLKKHQPLHAYAYPETNNDTWQSINASDLDPQLTNTKCLYLKACCLRCCCPVTFCIMTLLIAIQASYSANSPPIQGSLYAMKYDGYTYNLQAICKGIRTMKYNFTIILSHGGGANSVSLQELQNHLSTDYRVCVYTRPGYAWSDAAPFEAMGNVNNTVLQMLDLMENKLNEHAPYVVIGHSVGGQIAKHVAFLQPDKVIGLILLDSVPDFRWQMIDSNGTFEECVTVFNSRMRLLEYGRFLTPFGLLRPFLGSQSGYRQYKEDQYWAVNLDSMWNSQWIEMKWQSQHYKDAFNMENVLLRHGILGNVSLLTIPAGLDENCTKANYDAGSEECIKFERKQRRWYEMHMEQKNASSHGQMIICPYPCAHDFAWAKAQWICDTITPFLQDVAKR
eukprot:278953_1